MKKTAVVILNYNGEKMLQQFLPSVVKYTPEDLADVIVADNASTDKSLEILSSQFPGVKTVVFDKNYGFAGGYNLAISKIDYEYILLLNSDVEATEGYLEPLVEALDKDPDVVSVQPKLLAQKEKDKFEYAGAAGGFLDKYGYPFCRGRISRPTTTSTITSRMCYGQQEPRCWFVAKNILRTAVWTIDSSRIRKR